MANSSLDTTITNQDITTLPSSIPGIIDYNPEDHMIIPIHLSYKNFSLQTIAMIDYGATSNFLNPGFAKTYDIPLIKKLVPHKVELVDGTLISSGPVTHGTLPLGISIDSHHETLSFDVAKLKHYPIILGLGWLQHHNPYIDWKHN